MKKFWRFKNAGIFRSAFIEIRFIILISILRNFEIGVLLKLLGCTFLGDTAVEPFLKTFFTWTRL